MQPGEIFRHCICQYANFSVARTQIAVTDRYNVMVYPWNTEKGIFLNSETLNFLLKHQGYIQYVLY